MSRKNETKIVKITHSVNYSKQNLLYLLMELLVGESGGLIGIKLLIAASFEVSITSFDCFSTNSGIVVADAGPIRGC